MASDGRLHIHHSNVLKFDMERAWIGGGAVEESVPWHDEELPPLHIIGNLPFNVATPTIIKCVERILKNKHIVKY